MIAGRLCISETVESRIRKKFISGRNKTVKTNGQNETVEPVNLAEICGPKKICKHYFGWKWILIGYELSETMIEFWLIKWQALQFSIAPPIGSYFIAPKFKMIGNDHSSKRSKYSRPEFVPIVVKPFFSISFE